MSARRVPPEPLPVEPWFRSRPGVEGFLRAIAEEPWDETHRLILADWLEEQGETDRADFVRLQVRAAALPTWLVPLHVQKRIERLWHEHQGPWSSGLPADVTAFGGLLCELRVDNPGELRSALEAVGDAADVHRLDLTGCYLGDWGPFFDELPAGCRPTLLDLTDTRAEVSPLPLGPADDLGELRLGGTRLDNGDLSVLASAVVAPRLHTLHLGRNAFGAVGLRTLSGTDHFPDLRRLHLDGNTALDDDGPAALARPAFAGLAALELSGTNLSAAGMPALAGAGLAYLETLGLSDNRLDGAAVAVLAAAASLRRLRYLDLSHNPIGTAGLAALAASPHLARLDGLNVRDCAVGPAGAKALARTEHLAALTALSIGGNRLGTRGVQAIAASPALGSLQALGLSHNKVGVGGAKALARSKTLRHLWSLHLGDDALGDDGVEVLVESENWRNLIALVLTGNELTDAAAHALAASPQLARLGALTLDRNRIGSAGVRALVESPHLRHLFALSLKDNPLSAEDTALLRSRWPFVECPR